VVVQRGVGVRVGLTTSRCKNREMSRGLGLRFFFFFENFWRLSLRAVGKFRFIHIGGLFSLPPVLEMRMGCLP
jgi:hypothetical protein